MLLQHRSVGQVAGAVCRVDCERRSSAQGGRQRRARNCAESAEIGAQVVAALGGSGNGAQFVGQAAFAAQRLAEERQRVKESEKPALGGQQSKESAKRRRNKRENGKEPATAEQQQQRQQQQSQVDVEPAREEPEREHEQPQVAPLVQGQHEQTQEKEQQREQQKEAKESDAATPPLPPTPTETSSDDEASGNGAEPDRVSDEVREKMQALTKRLFEYVAELESHAEEAFTALKEENKMGPAAMLALGKKLKAFKPHVDAAADVFGIALPPAPSAGAASSDPAAKLSGCARCCATRSKSCKLCSRLRAVHCNMSNKPPI